MIFRRIKRTTAQYLIIDSFVSPSSISLRREFVAHFNEHIDIEDIVVGNHQYFFYRELSFFKVIECFIVWLKFLFIAFINLFIVDRYPTNFYYFVVTNLINVKLLQPKSIFIFQMYDTSTYLTALLLQKHHNIHLSVSNSFIYGYNRYTELENANIILCHRQQLEEAKAFQDRAWFNVKSTELWGPEEIKQHLAVPIQEHSYDIGLYSSGYWARNGRIRERNVEDVRSYKHEKNPYHVIFMDLFYEVLKYKKELNYSVIIYTHPLEREWYSNHGIKPPFWDLAMENDIKIDLSAGNSLEKLYEAKIGIGIMSTVLLDRWYHKLKSFIYFESLADKDIYHPKYFGSYTKYFFEDIKALKSLIDKNLNA